MINRLAIIGVGLIGGSLALGLKKAGKVGEVVAYARKSETREQALQCGIADRVEATLADTVKGADMVLLSVPMGAMADVLSELADFVTATMIITDAGSAKAQVVEAAKESLGDKISQFVPGHPIAGTERSGPSAAFAELYQDHRVVLTPLPETDQLALQQVRSMWQSVGAEVFEMAVEHHDVVLAATSHLPHLLAFNLVGMLAQGDDVDEVLRYAAGGFKDFSRIASSDPVMWRDICLTNSDAILDLLQQYQHEMSLLEQAIKQKDGDYLMKVFERAKIARDTRFNDPDLIDNSEV